MNATEIRKQINKNQAQYANANDATKALLKANNEALVKELDALTGGKSTYNENTGTWDLSGGGRDAVTNYLELRDTVGNGVYGGYNAENDPAYSALKKSILRESDRSVEDTMGTYAGMTGGLPSTAAVTAAQEMGNYFRGQLADRQVELGEQDYNRWANEQETNRQMMSIYATEAEESAANLAAMGDFSAMGKLYGWTPAQIAEAQKIWLAENGGTGGGSGGGGLEGYDNPNDVLKDSLRLPDGAQNFPSDVLSAMGYGDGTGGGVSGAEKKYDNRTEGQIASMVEQYMNRNGGDASKVAKLINSGSAFTSKQKAVALAYLDAIS